VEHVPGVWRAPSLTAHWLGTDPVAAAHEHRALFIAGVLFGVAGGALVGLIQELWNRRYSCPC
jgi:hypothetical protein